MNLEVIITALAGIIGALLYGKFRGRDKDYSAEAERKDVSLERQQVGNQAAIEKGKQDLEELEKEKKEVSDEDAASFWKKHFNK